MICISKLSQISRAVRRVKLRITISKYHPWYLCQISLKKNKSCYYLYKYWPIFRMKQSLSFCIVVLMIWIGNTVNHLWNKHKHCSQRKIEAALLFSSSNYPWFSWAVCKREKLKWRDGDAICFSLSRACHFPRNFQENGRQKLSMLL